MGLPSYSVLIPAYNCSSTLEETIQSAMIQSHPPLEVLIIEDHSTDDTPRLLASLSERLPLLRVIHNEKNLGVAQARNRGFLLAAGDYIALLDADDLWEPTKMEEQLSFMIEHPCDFSYTGYSFLSHDGTPLDKIYNVPPALSFKEMLKENSVGCASVVLSKEIAQAYKMRGEYAHEDYVLWLELLRDGKTALGIDRPLMQYRLSPTSRSGDKKKAAKNRWIIYRQFLKLNLFASCWYFLGYAINGMRKHF